MKTQKDQFNVLFVTSADGILIVDTEGFVMEVNPACEKILGKKKQDIVGQLFGFPVHSGENEEINIINNDGKILTAELRSADLEWEGQKAHLINMRDVTEKKQLEEEMHRFDWLMEHEKNPPEPIIPEYGDVTELNTKRTILDNVGRDILQDLAMDAVQLLDTSFAVYESNGDYAFGMFISDWCGMMDQASRRLCGTADNQKALSCGKWLCHENCWNDSAKAAIESGEPTDIECVGGIHLYGVPIKIGDEIIGVVNIGYGNPPTDKESLSKLAKNYDLDIEALEQAALKYNPRPPFIIDIAKRRVQQVAKTIAEIVELNGVTKQLKKREHLLLEIGDMARVGGWEIDLVDNIPYWSEITKKIHEVPDDYVPNMKEALKFFPESAKEELIKAIKLSSEKCVPYNLELPLITAKGRKRWIHTKGVPECKDGKCINLRGTIQDITERKEAEAEINQLAKFPSQNPNPVLKVSEDGTLLFANSGSKLLLQTWQCQEGDFLPKKYIRIIEQVIKSQTQVEVDANDIAGSTFFLTFSPIPETNQVNIYGLDITQRKKAEEQIKRFKMAIESSNDAIGMATPDGKHFYQNKTFLDIFGEIRKDPSEVYEDKGLVKEIFSTIKKGEGWSGEVKMFDRNGEILDFLLRAYPVRNNDGRIECLVGVHTNITEQHKLEVQLQQAQRMESIGKLAGGVAHDFNNQLTAIIGYTSLLKSKVNDPKLLSQIDIIMNASERCSQLTKQLLAFSRKEVKNIELMTVRELVDETIILLKRSIDKKIVIKTDYQREEIKIKGDSNQLENAILNIAINARDAMPDGGKLTFSIKTADQTTIAEVMPTAFELDTESRYLELSITDTGTGMDETTLKKVFDPFFTTKGVGKGTGLGLSAVYGTVLNHDGVITVDSTPGKGSTFKIYLPESDDQINEKLEETQEFELSTDNTGKIMIIDDEDFILETASSILESLGYEPVTFRDCKKGIEEYKNMWQEIDLVILDFNMPEMNGAEVLSELLKINQNVKVLISSGYGGNDQIQSMMKAGALGQLPKPFNMKSLAKAVKNSLE